MKTIRRFEVGLGPISLKSSPINATHRLTFGQIVYFSQIGLGLPFDARVMWLISLTLSK